MVYVVAAEIATFVQNRPDLMQTLESTYYPQTNEAAQIKLQNRPQVGLKGIDSIPAVEFTRRHFNILEIDHTVPERFQKVTVRKAETAKVLSYQDSLWLNLKGDSIAFTNWQISLTPKITEFNETAYSLIDSSLIDVSSANNEGLYALNDSTFQSAAQESDTLNTKQQAYTEKKEEKPGQISIKPQIREEWTLSALIISILIAGFVKLNWGRYMNNVMQSIFFKNTMGKLEGSNASNFYPSFVMGALFYLNCSIFVFEILLASGHSFPDINSLLIILIIFAFLFMLFSVKILTYRIIAHIFETKDKVNEYLMGSSVMSKAYGILILPFIIFIPFVGESIQIYLIKAGLALFILLYLIQIGRGIRIILSHTFSLYYIILYLCALEFLPLAILFKVIFH